MATNNSIDNISGVWYFPLYDNNGNVTDYVSETGEVVASYEYDAFGRTIAQSGAMASVFPFRFSTKYYDAEAKLYYYGYRYYSPELGRWLTRDPIEEDGGDNLYAFCGNNGVGTFDEFGLFTIYLHEEGSVGHVGLKLSNGSCFDYGRYHGTYSGLGLLFPGPNVLKINQWEVISPTHKYTTFNFDVCKVLDDGIEKAAKARFDGGFSAWPNDKKFAKFAELKSNERYMGTDWNWNDDNCITFTFRTIVSGVKDANAAGNLSDKSTKQARTLLGLSFAACFKTSPKGVKDLLKGYSKDRDWISESK